MSTGYEHAVCHRRDGATTGETAAGTGAMRRAARAQSLRLAAERRQRLHPAG